MAGWTFQTLIDGGMQVTAHCLSAACRHTQELDLVRLRDTLGADTPAMRDDLLPRMKCSQCQSRNVNLIYTPDSAKHVGLRQNACAKARKSDTWYRWTARIDPKTTLARRVMNGSPTPATALSDPRAGSRYLPRGPMQLLSGCLRMSHVNSHSRVTRSWFIEAEPSGRNALSESFFRAPLTK
ncbi:hypothetical protein [Mesorhizobium sp.]|uniref:hypothetical protein n=1 Tax=Mesorhizobium sp. TaxID=1871066 RepID=UPI00257FBEAD|nr:hypothetical protein [Mesorhizobium sp.]